ncbi:MAG: MlaD family protein [Bacteroidota bacterium]
MKREIRIGLTLMAALVLAYLSLSWLSRAHLFAPEEKEYYLDFDNVNGLLEGDPVTIRGYTSGRVLEITPEASFVAVKIALDAGIKVFEDAHAEIQIKELMGGKQIAMQSGERGEPLREGARIKGMAALDFSSGFSQFGAMAEGFSPDQLSRVLANLEALLKGLGDRMEVASPQRIEQAFGETERMLKQLNGMLYRFNQEVDFASLDRVMKKAEGSLDEGKTLISNASDMMERIESKSLPKLEESFEKLPELLEGADKTMGQLNALLEQSQGSNSLAQRLFTDEDLSRKLDTTLFNLNKTLEQIHSIRVIVGLKMKKKDR